MRYNETQTKHFHCWWNENRILIKSKVIPFCLMGNLMMIWGFAPPLEFWLLRLFFPLEQISVLNFKQIVSLSLEAEVPLTKSKWFAGRIARKFLHWASCTRSREHTVLLHRGRQKKFEIPAGNKGRRTGHLQKQNSVALSHASARLAEENPATHWPYPHWAGSGASVTPAEQCPLDYRWNQGLPFYSTLWSALHWCWQIFVFVFNK